MAFHLGRQKGYKYFRIINIELYVKDYPIDKRGSGTNLIKINVSIIIQIPSQMSLRGYNTYMID